MEKEYQTKEMKASEMKAPKPSGMKKTRKHGRWANI
jgi:hypothetical protein